jgi:uncharacterized protein YbbK (DUF523 family)
VKTLVSACLLGRTCRYDGGSRPSPEVLALSAVVPVCPEELGGLGTPRPAAQLSGGDGAAVLAGSARVLRGDGVDVTDRFVAGAREAARLGEGCAVAVLKARSPSCGVGRTWIDGAVGSGDGVFAALLRSRGVWVRTDEDLG